MFLFTIKLLIVHVLREIDSNFFLDKYEYMYLFIKHMYL
jgi:hypothetical protein